MIQAIQQYRAWPIVAGALISAFGDALIPIAFAIECHRLEPSGWGMSSVLIALWGGRFIGMYWSQKRTSGVNSVRTMLVADLVRACAQLGLVAYILTVGGAYQGILAVIALCLSSFVYGLAAAFFMPARFVSIAELSTESQRNTINSFLSIVGDTSTILGALIGSIAVLTLGFTWVLAIDGATFILAILLLFPLVCAGQKRCRIEELSDNMVKDTLPDHCEDTIAQRKEGFVHIEGASGTNEVKASHGEQMPDADVTTANSEREHPKITLPSWVYWGLVTWLIISTTIGVLGAAGPTEVLNRFGIEEWAGVAMALGIGSLVGSTATLTGVISPIRWKTLHVICCVLMACQVICFALAPSVWAVGIAGFVGSMAVSISGIRWDNLGQSFAEPACIHAFAHKDQLVHTIAIPAGMLLFGVAGLLGMSLYLLLGLGAALLGAAILILLMRQYDE